MRRRVVQLLMFVVLACVVAVGMPMRATAQAPEAVKIRVRITDNGWNDQGAKFSVNVEEGQLIELIFVWDQQIHLADEHIFVLDGYNLESKTISFVDREATLRFVADKLGAFRLKCDADCEIHDQLKNGTLNVVRKGAGGAASTAAGGPDTRPVSKFTVAAPVGATVGQTAPLEVTAVNAAAAAIAGAKVRLIETLSFLGSEPQAVEVAQGLTDKDGHTTLRYVARRAGARPLKVVFDGDAMHQPASIELEIAVAEGGSTYRVEPPASIPGVNRFFVSGVLITIWGTMFIVALHVVAIARAGRTEANSGEGDRNG